MKVFGYVLLLISVMVGCSTAPITPTPLNCNGYPYDALAIPFCLATEHGTLIQAPLDQQVTLHIDAIEFTINGTALINQSGTTYDFTVLEGSAVAGLVPINQTVSTAQKLGISRQTDGAYRADYLGAYDFADLENLPVDQLPRPIIFTPPPTNTPAPLLPTISSDCPQPDNWTDRYVIEPGNNLTSIAQKLGVDLNILESANCISNPNSIQVGQILYAPKDSVPATQPAVTFTPSAVYFRADKESINRGECTTLRWDVQNIRETTLDSQPVASPGNQRICPTETTTYTLAVTYFDDNRTEHLVTVSLNQS